MQDSIGNQLKEGRFVYWKSKDVVARILKVVDNDVPKALVIAIHLPVTSDPRSGAVVLPDFLCIIDPSQDSRLEEILGAGALKQ